ncbi:HlyD family secretion protein [Sedimentitalea nanhaiensis]|uniref:Multidrug resistance efflux pump n=1 Tax=Sedimentitalea nanhaiensis TaxID=999627 RepID=A0A1I7E944_9RHOB|nr:biotin/lipoyl-binding protein [Sedimentitalea nanhaiensis]SFU20422.1 Multidrug resistance efflux pump [Sedimentitalea nanhaiensis]
MLELMITSIPFVLRILYLRWKKIPVTLYNVHYALFTWLVLALVVFFAVFYYHPKSYTAFVPFRTVPVVAEIGGDVTEVTVHASKRVAPGDVLFRIDDARQSAALDLAESRLKEVNAAVTSAKAAVASAKAALARANAQLARARERLADQEELRDNGSAAFRETELETAISETASRAADVDAAQSQIDAATAELEIVLPARRQSAEAALEQAQVELEKTVVRSRVSGLVEQVTLTEGARAAQIAVRPAMVIVPDRRPDEPLLVAAGFSQVALSVLHVGMAAEIACESSLKASMENTVLPARVARIQRAVATGQLSPTGRLLEPQEFARGGEAVVYFKMEHPEHAALLVDGTSCIAQTYTTHLTGSLEGSLAAHGIEALGMIKAILLRIKVWVALVAGAGLGGGGGH